MGRAERGPRDPRPDQGDAGCAPTEFVTTPVGVGSLYQRSGQVFRGEVIELPEPVNITLDTEPLKEFAD